MPLARPRRLALAASLLVAASMVSAAAEQDIPTPAEFFGRQVGEAGVLVRHSDILSYYEMLEERSGRVRLQHVGETTQGLPFYYALVSSPANLARLDEVLAANDKLYDPRGLSDAEAERIIRDNPAVVVVNEQIHSTEVGVSQAGILLAHRLAAGQDAEVRRILERVIVAHVPVHNPDGQEMVYKWLDEQRDTPYENSPPPFLYQQYVGHDNNRDWYMFTQVETRHSIAMQNRLRPQFTLDQHQQGSNGSRIFVPPFEDPWEPNVDPALIASNNMIGTFMGQYLTARGYRGVEWKQRYDAWTPARAYYHTHGGVRILTEVASSNYADDVEVPPERLGSTYRQRHWYFPMPWPGGLWSFAEVVDYSYAGAMAALRAAADLRPHLLRGMWEAQRRSVEPPTGSPYGFVFPAEQADPPVTRRLLEVLLLADVELFSAAEPFEAGGRDYGAGSVVVPLAQPAGRFAKSVLEAQEYPRMHLYEGGPIDPPYDVTAHTLPLLMNVRVDAIAEPFDAALAPVDRVPMPPGGLDDRVASPAAYLIDPAVNNSYTLAAELAGGGLQRATESFQAASRAWPAGTWIYRVPEGGAAAAARQQLAESARGLGLTAVGVAEIPSVAAGWVGAPRVGIYQSYVPSMPEGWTRFILEQYGIPYDVLRDADVRSGDLAAYGVILLPPGDAASIFEGRSTQARERFGRRLPPSPPQFAGGLGLEGTEALSRYVAEGGTLFTWAGATGFASEHLGAPPSLNQGLDRAEFNIPGSLLRVRVDASHWLGYGLTDETAVLFWNSPFWQPREGDRVVASYPESDVLMSGWIQGQQALAGNAALLEVPYDQGRIVLVGFSPEYRAQAHQTFKVIFNAVFRPRLEPPAPGSGDR